MKAKGYTEINAETWDQWAAGGIEWSIPVTPEEVRRAREGEWNVFLTPCVPVPKEWFGELKGKKLLGLASGGGQQMPIFAVLGAQCTLLDYSDAQLEADRAVAEREGCSIKIVKGDMTKRFPFPDESFDCIFHPVSNCYVEDVQHVWNECFRVLKPGGTLLAGMDNGLNFLFEDICRLPLTVANALPFNPLKMEPERLEEMVRRGDGVQFSHSLEEQIGGQLKAGFRLCELFEDRDRPGDCRLRDFAPQYFATRCIKEAQPAR